MFKKSISAIVLLSSLSVFAQNPASRTYLPGQEVSQRTMGDAKNILSLDAFPMLLGGLGLAYDRILLPRTTVGFYGNFETLKSNDSGDNKMSLQTVGMRAHYFLTGEAAEKGFYLGAALANISLKSTVRFMDSEGTGSDKKTGLIGSAGYQLQGRELNNGKFILNLALLAGPGMGAEYTAKSSKGVTTVEASIKNGVGAEASLGFLF